MDSHALQMHRNFQAQYASNNFICSFEWNQLWPSARRSLRGQAWPTWEWCPIFRPCPLTTGLEQTRFEYWSGWWFGCHQFYFPINLGNVIIPIDDLIFFRGVQTTTKQWFLNMDPVLETDGNPCLVHVMIIGPVQCLTPRNRWLGFGCSNSSDSMGN